MRRAASFATRQVARQRKVHLETGGRNPLVQITTLPNKIRVATEDSPGHFAGVGLFVDAGSRYETTENSGVSHFLDRMAFKVCRTMLGLPLVSSAEQTLCDRALAVAPTSK